VGEVKNIGHIHLASTFLAHSRGKMRKVQGQGGKGACKREKSYAALHLEKRKGGTEESSTLRDRGIGKGIAMISTPLEKGSGMKRQ